MNNLDKETLNKLKQMKEDYDLPWWKPSEIDDYDLKSKV